MPFLKMWSQFQNMTFFRFNQIFNILQETRVNVDVVCWVVKPLLVDKIVTKVFDIMCWIENIGKLLSWGFGTLDSQLPPYNSKKDFLFAEKIDVEKNAEQGKADTFAHKISQWVEAK